MTMARSRISFDDASQSLLDAAIDPSRWNDAMETIAQYAVATGVVLLQVKGRGPGTPHTASLQEGLDTYFRDEWHLRDERTRGLSIMRKKGIFVDQDFASPEELATSDYYQFLRKYGFNWSAGVGFTNADDEWCMVIERGDRHGPVTEDEQADFVRFGAHLSRAALLSRNLGYANATGMLDAYQSLGCASVLLDRFGRVIRHNALVEPLLGDGLDLSHGVLRCAHPADNHALDHLIARLGRNPGLNEIDALPPVVMRRPLKRPLVVHGIRLKGMASAAFSPAKSILLISDTEKPTAITSIDAMRQAFGLTPTEAALVAHLERELPLSVAAQVMGVSVETARSHLKRTFSKTGTNRQSDLLLLMRRLQQGR
jgi:DNA-binding CsgD family transcriptional regulator